MKHLLMIGLLIVSTSAFAKDPATKPGTHSKKSHSHGPASVSSKKKAKSHKGKNKKHGKKHAKKIRS